MSPAATRFYQTGFNYENEETRLTLALSNQDIRGKTMFDYVFLYYADEDATVKGVVAGQRFDLNLKKGWNVVNKTNTSTETVYKVGEPRRNFAWTVRRN